MTREKRAAAKGGQGIRFWQKVLAALLVVGVVPIALVSFVSIQKTRTDLTDLGVTNIQQRSTSTGAALDAYLQNRLDDIILVSRIPDVVRYATTYDPAVKEIARDALKAATARSSEYESVGVVDMTGKMAVSSVPSDDNTDLKFRQYFITPSTTGQPYISDPSYSVITNKPALFFSAAVISPTGKVVGVVRSRLNLTAIWSIVEADADSVGGAHLVAHDALGTEAHIEHDIVGGRVGVPFPHGVHQALAAELLGQDAGVAHMRRDVIARRLEAEPVALVEGV